METLEQIKKVITDYDKLVVLAKYKTKIMEELDDKFNTARGIEKISFDGEGLVYVTCDDSCRGCYDSKSFSFPLYYLSLNDGELKSVVEKEKIKRVEEEQAKKKQNELKEQQEKENLELQQYQRLKKKFER